MLKVSLPAPWGLLVPALPSEVRAGDKKCWWVSGWHTSFTLSQSWEPKPTNVKHHLLYSPMGGEKWVLCLDSVRLPLCHRLLSWLIFYRKYYKAPSSFILGTLFLPLTSYPSWLILQWCMYLLEFWVPSFSSLSPLSCWLQQHHHHHPSCCFKLEENLPPCQLLNCYSV